MALKKSELYSSLWQSCDELRGGMDASQYKDYVLVLLFLKYISDKYAGKKYAPITIPHGASFSDMAALKGKASFGDDINKKIIAPLAEAKNDKDKLTKASAAARLKDIGRDRRPGGPTNEDADERKVLQAYVELAEQAADTGTKLKTAQEQLTAKVAAKNPKLTEDEIKTLAAAVQGELDRVSQTLTGRIRQLAERYASPLPQLTDEVEQLAAKVAGHLAKMGAASN